MICRTLDEVIAAGLADGDAMPPLDQDQADLVAVILSGHQDGRSAAA